MLVRQYLYIWGTGTKSFAKASAVIVCTLLAGYSVIMFIIPFSRDGWFWSGYGFSVLAMLLTLAVSLQVIIRKDNKYDIYDRIYRVGRSIPLAWCYLVVQVVLGTLEVVLHFIPYKVGIIINILLFCAVISRLAIEKFLRGDGD